ncbi:MAG: hypothetical protein K2F71_05650 [Paramuribaculum sp.]|nr:hypothetical protein [Paramuribaculum sp.]
MPVKKAPHHHAEWRGYTIDELRYQRALTSARLEIQKERLLNQVNTIRGSFGMLEGRGIMGKMLRSLNYIDYAVLAFQAFRRLRGFSRGSRG